MAEHGTCNSYNRGCRCEECSTAKSEYARKQREANPAAHRERCRANYAKNRDARRAYARAYREANLDAVRERRRAYEEANREAFAAYREANREAIAAYGYAHRVRVAVLTEMAVRNGMPFEPWEDAEILRDDIRGIDVAAALGRTLVSVKDRRYRLRHKAIVERRSA